MLKLSFFLLFLTLGACRSEDPAPELKDPIYLDLQKEYRLREDQHKKSLDKVAQLEKEAQKMAPRSIDIKTNQKELLTEKETLLKIEKEKEYYRIASIKRRAEAQVSYKKAFAENKEWPDPKEYETYQNFKKLREKSRNWNERVPKLNNPLNKDQSDTK